MVSIWKEKDDTRKAPRRLRNLFPHERVSGLVGYEVLSFTVLLWILSGHVADLTVHYSAMHSFLRIKSLHTKCIVTTLRL